jgi:hypothetical protein
VYSKAARIGYPVLFGIQVAQYTTRVPVDIMDSLLTSVVKDMCSNQTVRMNANTFHINRRHQSLQEAKKLHKIREDQAAAVAAVRVRQQQSNKTMLDRRDVLKRNEKERKRRTENHRSKGSHRKLGLSSGVATGRDWGGLVPPT